MLLATFVTADKSSSRRGAKLSPSETKETLAPGRETIPAPLRRDGGRGTPHPALRATFPPGGRLEGCIIQRREALKGKALGLYCALILFPALPKMSCQAASTLAASSWAS